MMHRTVSPNLYMEAKAGAWDGGSEDDHGHGPRDDPPRSAHRGPPRNARDATTQFDSAARPDVSRVPGGESFSGRALPRRRPRRGRDGPRARPAGRGAKARPGGGPPPRCRARSVLPYLGACPEPRARGGPHAPDPADHHGPRRQRVPGGSARLPGRQADSRGARNAPGEPRGELALDRKGLPALEGMLVARGLMYSSVYFHKTVRIAEEMLARAVERSDAPIADIQKMVDHELLNWLVHQGPLQREIALRLKYRKLYKLVLASDRDDLTDATRTVLASFKDPDERRRVEDRIARRAGVKAGQVIVDVPLPELLLSEPRIAKTEVPILDEGDVKPFSKASPLGRALQVRQVVDWVVMVAAPAEAVDAVRKASMSALFG